MNYYKSNTFDIIEDPVSYLKQVCPKRFALVEHRADGITLANLKEYLIANNLGYAIYSTDHY